MNASYPAWRFFASLQSESNPQSVDQSSARDEALDVVLHEIVSNRSTDEDFLRRRYCSLCRNRLTKYNHRRALDRHRFRGTHRRGGTDFGSVLLTAQARTVLDQLDYIQLTDLIRTVLPEEELRLLLEIADGQSYEELARDRNTTLTSLKSKAFRIRERVRNSKIFAALSCALRTQTGAPYWPSRSKI
jgi:hypothetical protein